MKNENEQTRMKKKKKTKKKLHERPQKLPASNASATTVRLKQIRVNDNLLERSCGPKTDVRVCDHNGDCKDS